jgi:hypothetical protein
MYIIIYSDNYLNIIYMKLSKVLLAALFLVPVNLKSLADPAVYPVWRFDFEYPSPWVNLAPELNSTYGPTLTNTACQGPPPQTGNSDSVPILANENFGYYSYENGTSTMIGMYMDGNSIVCSDSGTPGMD